MSLNCKFGVLGEFGPYVHALGVSESFCLQLLRFRSKTEIQNAENHEELREKIRNPGHDPHDPGLFRVPGLMEKSLPESPGENDPPCLCEAPEELPPSEPLIKHIENMFNNIAHTHTEHMGVT